MSGWAHAVKKSGLRVRFSACKIDLKSLQYHAVVALLLSLLFTRLALAGTTTVWTYGSETYPTQASAVAAMQAANPQNSVLTVQGAPVSMGNNSIKYPYTAPTPIPAPQITDYWGGSGSPYFSTDEQALTWEIQTYFGDLYYGCQIGTHGPGQGWVYISNLGSPSWGPGYQQRYDFTYWQTSFWTGECDSLTDHGGLIVNKWQAYSCPAYYSLNGTQCFDSTVDYISSTTVDCPKPAAMVGDPCDAASGDFAQTETDYSGPALSFHRFYHSATLESFHNLGVGWTHDFAGRLVINAGPQGLLRPDGYHDTLLQLQAGSWVTLSGNGIHLTQSTLSGSSTVVFVATLPDGSQEIYSSSSGQLLQLVSPGGATTTLNYDANGLLTSVVGPFGHSLQFSYNAGNNISTVTDPSGNTITYTYDTNNNLISAQYQDGTSRTYQYSNPSFPNHLTGILDESSGQFLTVAYDSDGRAGSSQNAGGANAVSLVYGATTTTVTDALGATQAFSFVAPGTYTPRATSVVYNGLTTTYAIPSTDSDPQQRPTQVTDPNGTVTQYNYDSDHLKTKTEAFGTPQARTISYTYLSTSSALPTLISEPLRQTAFTYYPGTNTVQTKTITDTTATADAPRTWTYTYDSFGRVLTAQGPRTDVTSTTTYAYYTCATGVQCGRVQTTTDALGHVTTYNTYDAHGQPLTITDPNGVVTTLTYDARQRLTGQTTAGELTSYSYYPTGLLQTVTLPDGSSLTYTYDGAHRVTQLADGLGNKIAYTLDAMGNRTAENTSDPSGTLHRTHTRVFNELNQLYQDVNAANTPAVTTTYGYDDNGNQTSIAAPKSRNTARVYDPLNRLIQVTDPANGVTQMNYDAQGDLISVVDPRNLTTTYAYNGFGDPLSVVSPDTGTTSSTFDSAGNLATSTDARGARATYTYDALNRMTSVTYQLGGVTDQTVAFTYDTGTNGIGRLTGASDANHSMSWTYDALGRVTGKGQVVSGVTQSVGYGYTSGNLTSLVTPSGQSIVYVYNANHQVTGVTVNGTTLLNNVTYEPFGTVNGWTWGNASLAARSYDQDGKIAQVASGGETYQYTLDEASRITAISNSAYGALSWAYGYDSLDRLVSASSPADSETYTYTPTGTRLSWNGNAGGQAFTGAYTVDPNSNRITAVSLTGSQSESTSVQYDAAGHAVSEWGATATYNGAGRPVALAGTAAGQYVYNALSQRILKVSSSGTALFVYDESGHLLGEYDGSGNLIEETVWLADIPVATLQPSGSGSGVNLFYVHTDHLNTPRKVSRALDNQLVWRWDLDPFADQQPDDDPAGLGPFTYNLRYPGQYFDAESGYHYNHYRYYDPLSGSYAQSDPIGLKGGINTYAYVRDNPVSYNDPTGLDASTWGCDGDHNYVPIVTDKNPCTSACTKAHEEVHIADAKAKWGNDLCRNKPPGYIPTAPGNQPPGYDAAYKRQTECRAYRVEVACLQNAMQKCGCKEAARARLYGAEGGVAQYCN